ncbi:MAG TPA: hypothetical protein VEU96_20695 [Bryobacteraceae bacterium]|nr:hypothetical protein [Bryobacteraceae bacterium]
MADETSNKGNHVSTRDEVALEMMKFIAVTTGYGKGASGTGFTGKATKTPEEYADALLQLYERCRTVVSKEKD